MNPPTTPPEDLKGIAGLAKPQLQLVPPVINTAMAAALKIGADKYGPWNWRTNKVEIMTYLGAMRRHIDAVLEGEDLDPESGAHHLGHVAAGCAIVLDALAHGTLVDNRPPAHATESEVPLDPNDDLREFLAARKLARENLSASDRVLYDIAEQMGKEIKDNADTSVPTGKNAVTWGTLFAGEKNVAQVSRSVLDADIPFKTRDAIDKLEDSLIPPRQMTKPSRPILVADEQAPINLDEIAAHIDEVVNEFPPSSPLDPHA